MATKKKALKKSKLRHAEYYDFQEIQDKLYAESMDGKVFTNLKEDYSEFLGFKLKVIPRGKTKQGQTKFVVESHVREKSIKKIKDNLAKLTHAIQYPKNATHSEYEEIAKYNAFVLGVHDYYSMATKVSKDFRGLAFSVQKSQKTRFQQRLKTAAEVEKNRIPCHIANVIKERYGKSKQL